MRKEIIPESPHFDAGETAFFARELESVKKKTYDTKYKNLKAMELIPVDTSDDPASASITFQSFTSIGVSKIISDYADDAPRVDVYGTEQTKKVYRIGNSYGYDKDEIKRAMRAKRNLNQKKANTAKRATDQKIDSMAWAGDLNYNMPGFIDYPGITEHTIVDGASTNSEWNTKTPDEIIADMNDIVSKGVMEPTNGVETPDTMLMPIEQYNYIAGTRMAGGGAKTILKFFLENNPYINTVEWLSELKGAGTAGADRLMVYVKDDDHLTLDLPDPFQQLPAQAKGYGFQILTEAKCAGVTVYYPLAIAYGDGI